MKRTNRQKGENDWPRPVPCSWHCLGSKMVASENEDSMQGGFKECGEVGSYSRSQKRGLGLLTKRFLFHFHSLWPNKSCSLMVRVPGKQQGRPPHLDPALNCVPPCQGSGCVKI